MHGEKPMFEITERVQEYMSAQTTGCFLGPDIKTKALFDFLVSDFFYFASRENLHKKVSAITLLSQFIPLLNESNKNLL